MGLLENFSNAIDTLFVWLCGSPIEMIMEKVVVVDDRFAQNGTDIEARIAIDSVCAHTSSIKSIELPGVDNGAIHKTPVLLMH